MNPPLPDCRFGPFRVLDDGRALYRNGELVAISPKVLAVLVELLRTPGKVVGKKELLETVWAGSFVEDGNLTQSVSVLRKQLDPDFPGESPIETLPRVGYRFRAPVEPVCVPTAPVPDVPAEPVPAEIAAIPPPSAARSPFRYVPRLAPRTVPALTLGAVVAVVGMLAAFHAFNRHVLAGKRSQHRRVAVLGFRDLAPAPETAWMRSALQETIGSDLAGNSDLDVVPAGDVERAEREVGLGHGAAPTADNLRRLAADLDCNEIVSGSFLASGGSIRLDTHLLSAQDAGVLSTGSRTQPADRLLPLIADASQDLRRRFGLPAANSAQMQAASSSDPRAFALYSKGKEQLRLYDGPAAAKLFEQAIAADPSFPLAHLAYSSALTTLGQQDKAAEQARIAQSLAGDLPRRVQLEIEARAGQAERRYEEAAATYATLSSFYPEDFEYVWMHAAMLQYAGHSPEAVKLLLPLLNTQPAETGSPAPDPRLYSQLADVYATLGDWPSSLHWAQLGKREATRRGATVLYERLLTSESQAERYLQQLPQAEAHTREALQLARQVHDPSGELRALNRMGEIANAEGKLPEARAMLEQALALETANGEIQRQIHTLSALGQNLERSGDHAGAAAIFAREWKLAQSLGQPETLLGAELDLARQQMLIGHGVVASPQLSSIAHRAELLGDKQVQAEAKRALAGRF